MRTTSMGLTSEGRVTISGIVSARGPRAATHFPWTRRPAARLVPHLRVTELEHHTAERAGIPRLVLPGDDAEGPALMIRDIGSGARQQAFRHRLTGSGITTARVAGPAELNVLPDGRGHVLVTTRRAGFDTLGPGVDLGVMDRAIEAALTDTTRRPASLLVAGPAHFTGTTDV